MKTAIEIKTDMMRDKLNELLYRYCQSGLRGNEGVTFRALAELTSTLHSLAVDSMQSLNLAKEHFIENGGHQDTVDASLFRANAAVSNFMQALNTATQRAVDIEESEYDADTEPKIKIVHTFGEKQ